MGYYNWLKDTYSTMDLEMKKRLRKIFEGNGAWSYITEVISLDDNSDVKEIIERLNNKSELGLSTNLKEDIKIFFNYFYEEYLKVLIKEYEPKFKEEAKSINAFLDDKNIDIFKFMEDNSGVKFGKDYKGVFYYNLAPIGAMGFEHNNNKISTIHPSTNKDNLLNAPFHEYSHELFRSFTNNMKFEKLTNDLNKNKDLVDGYNEIGKNAYDWVGWCEENLVEGFAQYLEYKYYGKKHEKSTYVYDLKFSNYLIENNFNPEKITLEEISTEFYKKILDENVM